MNSTENPTADAEHLTFKEVDDELRELEKEIEYAKRSLGITCEFDEGALEISGGFVNIPKGLLHLIYDRLAATARRRERLRLARTQAYHQVACVVVPKKKDGTFICKFIDEKDAADVPELKLFNIYLGKSNGDNMLDIYDLNAEAFIGTYAKERFENQF